MEPLSGLSLDQDSVDLFPLRCIHSQAASYFGGEWDRHWTIEDIEASDESHKVECNLDTTVKELRNDRLFLAAYQKNGIISLLFTVSPKQKFPFCSQCSSKKCKCFRSFQNAKEEEGDPDESVDLFWKRLRTERPEPSDHFLEMSSVEDHFGRHGYNLTSFEYPIKRDHILRDKFVDRLKGNLEIPAKIVPGFEPNACERHGNGYNPSSQNLKKMSPNVKVFTETYEFIFDSESYGRPTDGNCKCILQADTHENLLWNLGGGKFICYNFLHSSIHKMTKGMAMNAVHSSRAESLSSLGITSSLTVKDLTRAITGFSKMMKFRDEDFQCNNCGETPEYIVCDGKSIGPAKRKVEHLEELDREDGDMTPLGQGSNFKDRVFLSMKQERDLVKNLLTDEISIDDFIESEFPTENGQLVQSLARRLAGVWPLELPAPYSKFLGSIAKYTSVAGYLQVMSDDPLVHLSFFCQERLDIRSSENRVKLQLIMHELPALWPNLLEILNLEKSKFLPHDVSEIVLILIRIRRDTFRNAAERQDEEYIPWTSIGEEHPTQFYPNWNIFRYPKKYDVSRTVDSDFCDKVRI